MSVFFISKVQLTERTLEMEKYRVGKFVFFSKFYKTKSDI